ncbi:VanZ family protein [Paucibacter sp. R3-3]|uniref:VanZ family protein n=1 Tax=Roseateles agri TaxID=3098619 RepID=A0ABU5DH04_9BURK|nr:VanZ family protein [Paucibacter sp. R3-3]MDY0745066.1 VanZ family protein [Paucibacter sp. R3-3]
MSTLRRPALYGAAFMTLFVIYGSFYPFDWTARPSQGVLADIAHILLDESAEASRVDFATNMLLGLPLAFCLMAWMTEGRRNPQLWRGLLAVAYCGVLAIAVETAQLYLPGRVASKYDVMAQVIGAALGVTVWFWRGERLWEMFFDWSPFNRRHSRWQQMSSLYLLLVYAYGLLPLDLTLSPQDLYEKWKNGHIFILPFHALHEDQGMVIYQYASLLAIWGVAAFLIARARALSAIEIIGRTVLAAAVLELLQLFVVSRTTDTTDVTIAGIAALAVSFFVRAPSDATTGSASSAAPKLNTGQLSLLVLGFTALTLALAWYPYLPRSDMQHWRVQLGLWQEAPLGAYLNSEPLTAATSAVQKFLLFAPWGAMASWLSWRDIGRSHVLSRLFLGWGLGLILVVEAGKLFLENKVCDPSNIVLEALAMVIAYRWVTALNLSRIRSTRQKSATATRPRRSVERTRWVWLWLTLAQIGLLMSVLNQLNQDAGLNYNLRALTGGRSFGQLLALSVAALTTVVPWSWWSNLPTARRRWWQLAFLAMALPALVTYPMLRIGAPEKLVFDIVGTPAFGWPMEIEPALRFAALNLIVVWGIVSAHRWLDAPPATRNVAHGIHWLIGSVLVAGVWHYVVVSSAVTDNLVELMRNEGSAGVTALLFVWWTLVYGSALQLGRVLLGQRPSWHLAVVAGTILPAYLSLDAALEPMLVKYGKVFSAWQFLLSQDRAHYAEPDTLMLRYLAVHAGLMLVLIFLLLPTLEAQRARSTIGAPRTPPIGQRPALNRQSEAGQAAGTEAG